MRFDDPFLFLIRNKDTNETWFVGTLYEAEEGKAVLVSEVEGLFIKDAPNINARDMGFLGYYEHYDISGNVKKADGYTWYELKSGGWVADDGKSLTIRKN